MTTTRRIQVTAAMLSLLLVSALVYRTSDAAFTDTTDNPANNWAAGTVVLEDDDGGASALFDTTNMVPGDSVSNCIEVDYTGTSFDLDPVTLYGSVTDDGLGAHLDVVISEGTGGGFGDCTGFSGSAVYSGTVNGFGAAHPNYALGEAGYTPASGNTARVYKIDVTLGTDTPDSVQGDDAQATFTWEVRSA